MNKPGVNNGKYMAIGFVYTANKIQPYAVIRAGILQALLKLPREEGSDLQANPSGKGG